MSALFSSSVSNSTQHADVPHAYLVDDGDVSLVLEQRLYQVVMSVDGCDHERRLSVLVLPVDVGALPQQQSRHARVTANRRCEVEKFKIVLDTNTTDAVVTAANVIQSFLTFTKF